MEFKTRYVIIAGIILAVLVILGMNWPLLAYMLYTQNHNPSSESICIAPAVHPDGLTRYWDTVSADLGFDASSAALSDIRISISPDDSVEQINIQFHAMKDGVDRYYSVDYGNTSLHCGHFRNESYAENRPADEALHPQDPREFLRDIEQINETALGLSNRILHVTTGNTRGKSLILTADTGNCQELYLQRNGSLQRVDRISTSNTLYPLYSREFLVMNCIETEPGSIDCTSERQVTVIPAQRLPSAIIVRNTTVPGPAAGMGCYPERTVCKEEKVCLLQDTFCYTRSSWCRTFSGNGTMTETPWVQLGNE